MQQSTNYGKPLVSGPQQRILMCPTQIQLRPVQPNWYLRCGAGHKARVCT